MAGVTFPNESEAYRRARDELLVAESDLRSHIERVAAQRRSLPLGGEIKENYVFEELVGGVVERRSFDQLFGDGHDTLFAYSFMYAPDMKAACPMCTAFLDGLDGQIVHIEQQISTAVVAKHDVHTIHEHAVSRGWRNLRLLSSAGNTYNVDYHAEVDGRQTTTANVFVRDGDVIRHFWSSELSYGPSVEGGNTRHVDMLWPLWNVLDMTPGGRGNWYPALAYK